MGGKTFTLADGDFNNDTYRINIEERPFIRIKNCNVFGCTAAYTSDI